MTAKRKILKFVPVAATMPIAAMLLIRPQRYAEACFNGLCLWAGCVLPQILPFTVVCLILCGFIGKTGLKSKKLTIAQLLVMSAASGYPTGSRLLREYYDGGYISAEDVKFLAPACSCPSPAFLLGTLGVKAFGGGYAGTKLWIAAIISTNFASLFYWLLKRLKGDKSTTVLPRRGDKGDLLFSSFEGAISACLNAGVYMAFFYTVTVIIADLKILMPLEFILGKIFGDCAKGICMGLTEATGGCFTSAAAGGFYALPAAGFTAVLSGASLLLQQLRELTKCGIGRVYFVIFKFIQSVIAFALLCIMSLFI